MIGLAQRVRVDIRWSADPCWNRGPRDVEPLFTFAGWKGSTMNNGTGRGEQWVQLIREVIASWRLLLGAIVLVLACTPLAAGVVMLLLITTRWAG